MSHKQYCNIQAELMRRFCERTGHSEMTWVKRFAKRFADHFKARVQ